MAASYLCVSSTPLYPRDNADVKNCCLCNLSECTDILLRSSYLCRVNLQAHFLFSNIDRQVSLQCSIYIKSNKLRQN